MEARRKSCIVAAGDWKKLFKGSAATAPPHRPSIISEVESVGKNSQSGIMLPNNLTSTHAAFGPEAQIKQTLTTHVPPPPPPPLDGPGPLEKF